MTDEQRTEKRMLQCAIDADYSNNPNYIIIREEMTIGEAEKINDYQ